MPIFSPAAVVYRCSTSVIVSRLLNTGYQRSEVGKIWSITSVFLCIKKKAEKKGTDSSLLSGSCGRVFQSLYQTSIDSTSCRLSEGHNRMQALLRKIRQILIDRRTRKFFTSIVSSVAAMVVFVTTYALILPAITLEKTASCGIEEHQHSDSCYEERLVCGQKESDGHHHDDSCYTTTAKLNCGIQEHLHSDEEGCYDADGNRLPAAGTCAR